MRYAASIRVRKLTTSRRQPFEPIRYKHPPQIPAESATASPSLSACSPSNSALSALESKFRQHRQCPSLARRSLRLESESRIPAESAIPLTCSISIRTPRFAAESATATGNPIRKCESRQKRQPILPSPHGRGAGVRSALVLPYPTIACYRAKTTHTATTRIPARTGGLRGRRPPRRGFNRRPPAPPKETPAMTPSQPPFSTTSGHSGPRPVRAPHGAEITCKGWAQEAALRMLMNNLDPDVAERPDDLVVYGGSGKAARNWDCFDAIVRSLRELENDETLLVQSGKPVGIFRTHPGAPRVLIANSNLVPHWGNWDEFRRLEAMGLTMYGQMTAGSWIYIGSQGIVQGTYETFAEAARQRFSGTLKHTITLTGGLGGMGGAQPLSVTMNEGVCLAVEVDPQHIQRRLETGYCDEMASTLDEALHQVREACQQGQPLSIGLIGNAAEVYPELVRRGIVPDIVTDQTSAHDALNGYVPAGLSLAEADELRERDPQEYIRRSQASMVAHVRAMLEMQQMGAIVFDYGNNL